MLLHYLTEGFDEEKWEAGNFDQEADPHQGFCVKSAFHHLEGFLVGRGLGKTCILDTFGRCLLTAGEAN